MHESPPTTPIPPSSSLWLRIRIFVRRKFDLGEDQAPEEEVRANINKGVDFHGANLWVLIFAIFIASIGLNVNSTAVIIGAMLISPLMGPIMGVGLALGVSNFELMKRSLRNLLFATAVGLLTSYLYFLISPLETAQSELLARTTPTIYDVMIALFGGLAGIVAQTRKDRSISTVIPGVAIATALMPPLCTAGFGLAQGNWQYVAGAFYLYFINAIFIALGTYIIVRFLGYKKIAFVDPRKEKKVRRFMTLIIIATAVPSVILAYGIVQRTIFDANAKNYIERVLTFDGAQVVSTQANYSREGSTIEVVLVGQPVSNDAIELARSQLSNHRLFNTKLVVTQPTQVETDLSLKGNVLKTILENNTQLLEEKNEQIRQLKEALEQHRTDSLNTAITHP